MTTQIISTKLFVPAPRPDLVSRPRLLDRLERGAAGKLTLIMAQAGFGKTTLLSEWISRCGKPVCWLSLDEGDNDLQRFLEYMLAAMRKVKSGLGEPVLLALRSQKTRKPEELITWIINEVSAGSESFILVLDDYHAISEPEIQQALLFLLDHLPPQMHLILASRADPPWPLAKLRVRGDMLEIRSQEMRFSLEEAATFLNERMGLALSPQDIAALEKRTEGWIVGLQLAALSMHQRPDKRAFIQTFAGSHRYVMDYLVEEVLSQQPPEIQEFLLKTSILPRFTASLCDALLGEQGSQDVFTELERKNLFLIPLDEERRWYRYHHLFADLLRLRLGQKFSGDLLDLHRKASLWFEQHGLLADALNHALVSKHIERIVQLTEELTVYQLDHGELKILLTWLETLPESTLERYPWLLVTRTWALFNLGKYGAVEENLDEIETVLSTQTLPSELENRVRGHAAALRSYLAELRDDPRSAARQAEAALAWLPEQDIQLRSFVAIRWANCLSWVGDLERSIPIYREAGESCKRVGESQLALTALSEMAMIQMVAGKLRQAVGSIHEITRYAEALERRDGRKLPAMGVLYRHLSSIQLEQNQLAEADHSINEAIKICRQWGEKEALFAALLASTRVQFSQGNCHQLDRCFQEIDQIAGQISPEYVARSQNWRVRYQLINGKLAEAEEWVQRVGLKAGELFDYQHRDDYANFARYLFLKGEDARALNVLEAVLKTVSQAGAGMYTIQFSVLRAIILSRAGRREEALDAMGEALSRAHAEGYVRSIMDEGEPVGELLRMAISKDIEVRYASHLLQIFQDQISSSAAQRLQPAKLVDPLSQRELEVLRLLITDLTAPEIAGTLFVSASTVRSHIKQIYSKLDAHSRYEAVTIARQLNLL